MDLRQIVQKKLSPDERCLKCIEAAKIVDDKRHLRIVAIAEKRDEHAIFIFTTSRIPCLSAEDMKLETVLPVESQLRCHAEAPRSDKTGKSSDFLLGLKSPEVHILLEMPQHKSTQAFLAEIKRAQDFYFHRTQTHKAAGMHSQNAAFGSAPSFDWLTKYRNKLGLSNPFADDVFDPMKYMNLDDSNTTVSVSDPSCSERASSSTRWFTDEFDGKLELNGQGMSASKGNSFGSRDSLDFSRDFYDSESIETMQKQLGLGPGVELPLGAKPVTSREAVARRILSDREDEFIDLQKIKVFCGTWNVNGQSPCGALNKWLTVDHQPPDIYAIGFQELDLSREAFIFNESAREAEWQEAVKDCLHAKGRYRKVKSVRLVGILLIVYITEKLAKHVSFLDTDTVPTGIMGIMGNKGGVGVRFTLQSTSLCFINSHLAAHQDEFERRNQDYRDILGKMRFKQFVPPLTIGEHDLVFWIGDLNYRISNYSLEEVKGWIHQQKYKILLSADQLSTQLGHTDVFRGFEEGPITFDPTYKFDPGTDVYDSSDKSRIPAWCDRILWQGVGVHQLRYDSHPQLRISDHKPVSAMFDVEIKVIDEKRYKKTYEDIMKKLDRIENEYLPQIKLDKTECHFKDVKFVEPQFETITIANVGQAYVEFEFIKKLDDASYSKPWLSVTPYKDVIKPGLSCDVQLEVYVDKNTVGFLNSGRDNLEDILVLHLHGGKDIFITVGGNYLSSSFGSSLEALIQMHQPIRELPVDQLADLEQPGSLGHVDISKTGGRLYMVPKELWRLIEHINVYGKDKADLFQVPGLQAEIQQIRDCLDSGVPDKLPGSVHSVAESLLLFLECLAEPVIPFSVYQQCLSASNNLLLSKQVLSQIPDFHKNTFHYVCEFLKEMLKYSDYNGLDIKFVAALFGEVVMRTPPSASRELGSQRARRHRQQEEEAKKAAFMYHFLTNDVLS
ncbi:inositol polyphosphate 5-phosphatase OCRL-like isoform X2 [Babylonia areolata]|uniref:inositol polyphosphate 5-phosphatase OCRL-like isoform X2 n=1 Tax=Babylonia areolata TaxID=304850 RepID=UPI003FD30324